MADYVTVDNKLPASGYYLAYAKGFHRYSDSSQKLWIRWRKRPMPNGTKPATKIATARTTTRASPAATWRSSTSRCSALATSYYFESNSEKQILISALAANQAVTMGTNGDGGDGLYGDHAYMVISYTSAGGGTFTLYNPWGCDQPGPLTWTQLTNDCDFWVIANTSGAGHAGGTAPGKSTGPSRAVEAAWANFVVAGSHHDDTLAWSPAAVNAVLQAAI